MRELQEDSPAPACEERHLAMEPPAHRAWPERWCSIHVVRRSRAMATRRPRLGASPRA
jgi:hypothetical protein